jgi:hypothetical protein
MFGLGENSHKCSRERDTTVLVFPFQPIWMHKTVRDFYVNNVLTNFLGGVESYPLLTLIRFLT